MVLADICIIAADETCVLELHLVSVNVKDLDDSEEFIAFVFEEAEVTDSALDVANDPSHFQHEHIRGKARKENKYVVANSKLFENAE